MWPWSPLRGSCCCAGPSEEAAGRSEEAAGVGNDVRRAGRSEEAAGRSEEAAGVDGDGVNCCPFRSFMNLRVV